MGYKAPNAESYLSITIANMSPLSDVLALITQGVHELEAAYADADVTFPSLDDPWKPGSLDSSTKASSNLVAAAAFQLISMVRDPHAAMFETAQSVRAFALPLRALSLPGADVLQCRARDSGAWQCG